MDETGSRFYSRARRANRFQLVSAVILTTKRFALRVDFCKFLWRSTMKILRLTFVLLIFSLWTFSADAQDDRNEKEALETFKTFRSFILKKQDFADSVNNSQESVKTSTFDVESAKNRNPDRKKGGFFYEQTFVLNDDTTVIANYLLFKDSQEASDALNFLAHDFASAAREPPPYVKRVLGLKKQENAYYYNEPCGFALRVQAGAVCFFIDVKSIIKPKEDIVRECCEYVKIVVKRINGREKSESEERRQ